MPKLPRFSFAQANNVLLIGIIIVDGYLLAAPVLPRLSYWWQSRNGVARQHLEQKVKAIPLAAAPSTKAAASQPAVPATTPANEVIIPSILLDQTILEGRDTYAILNKGVWRFPSSSTPDKGGNTVLVGHRFTYTNPRGVFYNLDKVKLNDPIDVRWGGKLYDYQVSNITIVNPTQTSIEAPTSDARLTLFTCTPLWNPVQRLVITASLEPTT